MTFSIPNELWNKYYEMADLLIDDEHIGVNCTLVYPEKKIACNNCIFNTLPGGVSTNVYKNGGPMPFSYGPCPLCGGTGYKSSEETDSIRLRVYWRHRDWLKVGQSINYVDGRVQVIGYLKDFANFRKANTIILVSDQTKYQKWTYAQAGNAFPHGFGKNRYFVAFLDRT